MKQLVFGRAQEMKISFLLPLRVLVDVFWPEKAQCSLSVVVRYLVSVYLRVD